MTTEVIYRAPEPGVLWHRENHATTRFDNLAQRIDRRAVVVDVLEHIEGNDDIELRGVRKRVGVCREEKDAIDFSSSHSECLESHIAPSQSQGGKPFPQTRENKSSTAADIQKLSGAAKVPGKPPLYEGAPAAKPEVGRLSLANARVEVGRVRG